MGQTLRYFRNIGFVLCCDLQIDIGEEGILLELLQEAQNRQVQIAECEGRLNIKSEQKIFTTTLKNSTTYLSAFFSINFLMPKIF
jgi:hypothetical protein